MLRQAAFSAFCDAGLPAIFRRDPSQLMALGVMSVMTHLVEGCSSSRGETLDTAASSQRPVSRPQRVMAVRKPAAAATTASSASANACTPERSSVVVPDNDHDSLRSWALLPYSKTLSSCSALRW
jgi:hypothetical protein